MGWCWVALVWLGCCLVAWIRLHWLGWVGLLLGLGWIDAPSAGSATFVLQHWYLTGMDGMGLLERA